MSLALILFGTALVTIAMFNKVPQYVPGRLPSYRGAAVASAPRDTARPRVRLARARLTEQGRALLTAVGGSVLIAAFFLILSGF